MKIMTWLTIGFVTLSLTGCEQMRDVQRLFKKSKVPQAEAQTAAVINHEDEVRLAEVVLKPKQRKLSVKSDPFQPLALSGLGAENGLGGVGAVLSTIKYVGMMKMGTESSVLIQTAKGSNVYKLNDEVEYMRISEINAEFITLTKDGKTFQLKRGAP